MTYFRGINLFYFALFIILAVAILAVAIQSDKPVHAHADTDSDSNNGVSVSLYANGNRRTQQPSGLWLWDAWADINADLVAKGKPIGWSASGDCDLHVYLASWSNSPKKWKKSFTLKVKGWGPVKWGTSYFKHWYQFGEGGHNTPPYGWATAKGKCGLANPKDCHWPHQHGSGSGGGGGG
jgi:hypothetical protein